MLKLMKNSAESLCNSIDKALKDAGDKLSEDDKKTVADAVAAVRESVKSNDIKTIDNALEELNKKYEPIVKKLYPNSSAPNGSNVTPEQMRAMMNDPKFKEMFGNGTGTVDPNFFAEAMKKAAENKQSSQTNDDGTVEAEVV